MASSSEEQLKTLIIQFYRKELELRYQLDNVRRFSTFKEVPDDTIARLRDYFLGHIYPPPRDRKKLDEAFDHLGRLLSSPKRLRPLVGTMFTSLWTLGRQLPAAISAGRSTFDAYAETRKLEQYMLKEARKQVLTVADSGDHHRMLSLIARIPEKHVHRLIKDIMSLFHSLTNIALLRTSHEIMQRCYDIMESRPEIYEEDEREGLRVGLRLLQGGLELFESMDARLFPVIIAGIEEVENDWYERVREEAGVPAN
jgi:hypothetical protein